VHLAGGGLKRRKLKDSHARCNCVYTVAHAQSNQHDPGFDHGSCANVQSPGVATRDGGGRAKTSEGRTWVPEGPDMLGHGRGPKGWFTQHSRFKSVQHALCSDGQVPNFSLPTPAASSFKSYLQALFKVNTFKFTWYCTWASSHVNLLGDGQAMESG
jgi:hypothetical protein